VAVRRASAADVRRALWSFVLEFFARRSDAQRSIAVLTRDFFTFVRDHELKGSSALDRHDTLERLFHEAVAVGVRAGNAPLRTALTEHRGELLDQSPEQRRAASPGDDGSVTSRLQQPRQRMAFSMTRDEPEAAGEPIHIGNAGLVIVAAFLPTLFERLEVLEQRTGEKRRVRPDAVSRAVHLLQYLVDGRTDAPEPTLCLNKVLCGVPFAAPIDREMEITLRERELCDSLLAAIIENWTIIKNTSIEGLRETFLQRQGRLERAPDSWRLRVQRKTLDVLLDYIPWTVSTIAHSWMPEPLYVTW
jgi:hypothetical protein